MTYYDNDPNRRMDTGRDIQSSRHDLEPDGGRSYMGWIVGAALVVALIVGVFAYSGNKGTDTAVNSSAPSTSSETATTNPARSTTGSGAGTSTPAPTTPKPAAPAR